MIFHEFDVSQVSASKSSRNVTFTPSPNGTFVAVGIPGAAGVFVEVAVSVSVAVGGTDEKVAVGVVVGVSVSG